MNIEQIERDILQSEKIVAAVRKYMSDGQDFDYSMLILKYTRSVEYMLIYIYEKNGIEVTQRGILTELKGSYSQKGQKYLSALSYPKFAVNCDFLPNECKIYVDQMRQMRNNAAHAIIMNYADFISFKELFQLFRNWFLLEYADEYEYYWHERKELEKEILDLNNKMKGLETSTKSYEQLQKHLLEVVTRNEELEQKIKGLEIEKQSQSDAILSQIASRMASMENLVKSVKDDVEIIHENQVEISEENKRQFKGVNEKLDTLHKEIKDLASIITQYQGDITRVIDKYQIKEGDERYEQALTEFSDKIAENISRRFSSTYLSDEYSKETVEIKDKFKGNWEMLSINSQRFLITARLLYRQMLSLDELADYSGVCILITKALEEEMHKRFYGEFKKYLQTKYPLNDVSKPTNYTNWHTSMYYLNHSGEAFCIQDYNFTLGSVAYICYKKPKGVNNAQQRINNVRILEFSKECLFKSNYDESYISSRLKEIGDNVAEVTFKYRNRAAHTNQIRKIDAEKCFDFVVLVEQILVKMLKEFRI